MPAVLLPSALVIVLATLMIQQAIDERVAKSAHVQKNASASLKLLVATKSAIMSISSVAVQFTGNLVALGLSEVRIGASRGCSTRRAGGATTLTVPCAWLQVITNSRDSGWVLWFVLIAIMMVYVATDTISAAAS